MQFEGLNKTLIVETLIKNTGSQLFIFILLALSFSFFSPLYAQENKNIDYQAKASAAIEKARQLNLSARPYWHTLLHYKPSGEETFKSLVDDPKFFLAKNGKTNPQAELEATINAFFALPEPEHKHATAAFPGRYKWICQNLNLSGEDFPYNGDAEYTDLMSKLAPDSIYLIFPAGYMKNPASVFGHTFILVESKGQSRLLANSISYGADAGNLSGFLYAFLGLTGGFKGFYGFKPYYDRIREYSAIDMRDMWEYKLKFSEDEKDSMLRHIIDMRGIYSNYYFITENCSYNLLYLIEAAKPETKVTSTLTGAVEPIETVKLIYNLGLTDEGTYRPSLFSKVENYKSYLTEEQNKFAKQVCIGKKTPEDFAFTDMSKEQQAILWDTCAEYLQHLLSIHKIELEDYRKRYISVLSARRKLGKINQKVSIKIPEKPHKAHGSKKFAMHGGKDGKGNYAGINWRLTAHDQLENPAGYSKNSQLVFFSVDARLYSDNSFQLKNAIIAEVISLPASDIYFLSTAFHGVAGWEQNFDENKNDILSFRGKFFEGYSIEPASWVQFYMMIGPDCYFNPCYDYCMDLLLGGEAGFITTFGNWKNKVEAQVLQSPLNFDHFRSVFSADQRLTVTQNLNFSAKYAFNIDFDNTWHEFSLSMNINF